MSIFCYNTPQNLYCNCSAACLNYVYGFGRFEGQVFRPVLSESFEVHCMVPVKGFSTGALMTRRAFVVPVVFLRGEGAGVDYIPIMLIIRNPEEPYFNRQDSCMISKGSMCILIIIAPHGSPAAAMPRSLTMPGIAEEGPLSPTGQGTLWRSASSLLRAPCEQRGWQAGRRTSSQRTAKKSRK